MYIAKLDQIYIHVDRPFYGPLWQKVTNDKLGDKVKVVFRQRPIRIYGQSLKKVAHVADVIKSSVMYEYGGVMMDTDIVFIRKIDQQLREYEAVVSPDVAELPPFPHTLNMGISLSKPRSEFARMWLESERHFQDERWLWNCGQATYKFWERKPWIAKVSNKLQKIIYNFEVKKMWDGGSDSTHQDSVISIHPTFPDPYVSWNNTLYKNKGLMPETARKSAPRSWTSRQNRKAWYLDKLKAHGIIR